MANFLYKILGMFSLTDDYDDEDEYDDEDDYEDDDEEEVSSRFKSKRTKETAVKEKASYSPEPRVEKKSNVLPYNKKNSKGSGMAVCVIKPTTLEDGREISDTLLSGRAVVLNLEDVDGDMAQRIIDFTSGACYSMGGNLQKISTFIFVVTPSSVDIAGDFQDVISSAAAAASASSSNSLNNFNNPNRYRF